MNLVVVEFPDSVSLSSLKMDQEAVIRIKPGTSYIYVKGGKIVAKAQISNPPAPPPE